MDKAKLIKYDSGVAMYKINNMLQLYVNDIKILEIDENFKGMLDKSYDNLVKIQKQKSNS